MADKDDFVIVAPEGRLVYVLIADREKFNKLGGPVIDHGDKGDKGHVLSKSIGNDHLYVVFQHWVKDPLTSWERRPAENAEARS